MHSTRIFWGRFWRWLAKIPKVIFHEPQGTLLKTDGITAFGSLAYATVGGRVLLQICTVACNAWVVGSIPSSYCRARLGDAENFPNLMACYVLALVLGAIIVPKMSCAKQWSERQCLSERLGSRLQARLCAITAFSLQHWV